MSIFEGFIGNAADRVRQWFRTDKGQANVQIAKGAVTAGLPMSGQDMTQAYGYDALADFLRLEHDLLSRYIDYEEMDDYDLIANAIDIFSDDATQLDIDRKRTVWVSSADKTIAEIGDDLFHRRLRIDEEIWEIARTVVKYGNDFEEVLLTNDGVVGLNYLAPATVRRIEGPRGELYGFVQDFRGRFGITPGEYQQIMAQRSAAMQGIAPKGSSAGGLERVAAFEDWEVVHFRIRGKHRRSAYGTSVLEPARWISKRLTLLEDSAMIYRLQRAAERYAFYVDIGNLPPQEALPFLNRVRQQHRKQKFINPSTGKLDLKPDFLNQNDDFFVPVANGSEGTRIEVLGSPNWQSVEDLTYFLDKLLAALKVPKAYLAQQDGVNRGTLSSEDVRFARTVLRIQNELRNGLSKVFRIHLTALGIDPHAAQYGVHMTVPSAIFELAQLEVKNARADFAARMQNFVSYHWLLSKVFGMSDEEIQNVMAQRAEDAEREGNIQATSQSIIQRNVAQAGIQGQTAGQIDANQMMMQAGMSPPQDQGEPGPSPLAAGMQPMPGANGMQPPLQAPQESRIGGPLIRIAGPRKTEYYGLERKLFEGSNPKSDRRLEEKIEKLFTNDRRLTSQMFELKGMLQELNMAVSNRRR